MQEVNLYQIFTEKLNNNNIPYAVTGSVASIIYGEPRMTHDIDLVLEVSVNTVDNLITSFNSDEFYVPPIEIIKTEILRSNRGHCNIIHISTGFKADLYFTGNDDFQIWAIKNAKQIDLNNSKFFIVPPEYVIIKKLEYYKEGNSQKHIADIKAILYNSNESIDFNFLEEQILKFGLLKEWKECN